MKALLAAAALLAVGATAASAQYAPYHRDHHPYHMKHHQVCMQKSHRLHDYERRAARDGVITPSERRVIIALKRDLDRVCGGHRHRG
jgi:hypothetical protein